MMRGLVAGALLLASPVLADVRLGYPGTPDHSGPYPDRALRFDLGGGFEFGALSLAKIDALAAGLDVEAGARYDRFALAADYGWSYAGGATKTDPAAPWASARRVSLDARYTLWSAPNLITPKRSRVAIDTSRQASWLELGIGREDIHVHPGDHVSRPTLSVGVGTTSLFYFETRHSAASLVVRLLRAPSPSGGVDHSLVVGIGVTFGN